MVRFYGWGSTVSRVGPLRGGSLLFITRFPEIPAIHFIDLGRIKGAVSKILIYHFIQLHLLKR